MPKLNRIEIEGETFYYSLSFDIDDWLGDGFWWLQIYYSDESLICDNRFAPSMADFTKADIITHVYESLTLEKQI